MSFSLVTRSQAYFCLYVLVKNEKMSAFAAVSFPKMSQFLFFMNKLFDNGSLFSP